MPPLNTFTRTCLAVALGQMMFVPAHAASIIVNDSGDAVTNAPPQCTLRDAIVSANTNAATGGCISGTAGTDTITFHGTVGATISLTQALHLDITDDLIINGPNSDQLTIDGMSNARVFRISDSIVSLNKLTIKGGAADSNDGGGIYVRSASVSLINGKVSDNSARYGGGIDVNSDSSVNLIDSTVSGNSAYISGGGIHAAENNYVSVSLINSTVSDNTADHRGGGIYVRSSAFVSLINSTVSGNSAFGGGGIAARNVASVSLSNSTVSGNSAGFDGGGIQSFGRSSVSLSNSIIANSEGSSDCIYNDYYQTYNNGTVSMDSATIIQDSSCDAMRSGDPSLLPLAYNGGATKSHAITSSSIARNTGILGSCEPKDQRGQVRDDSFFLPILASNRKVAIINLGDGECDVGAVEFNPKDN